MLQALAGLLPPVCQNGVQSSLCFAVIFLTGNRSAGRANSEALCILYGSWAIHGLFLFLNSSFTHSLFRASVFLVQSLRPKPSHFFNMHGAFSHWQGKFHTTSFTQNCPLSCPHYLLLLVCSTTTKTRQQQKLARLSLH